MKKCVFYTELKMDVPENRKHDGLNYTICGNRAPYLVNGSSYCFEHVSYALGRTTIKAGRKK